MSFARPMRLLALTGLFALLFLSVFGEASDVGGEVRYHDAGIEGGDHDRARKRREQLAAVLGSPPALAGAGRQSSASGNSAHPSQQPPSGKRNDPPMILFLTCVVSHVTILPALRLLWRRRWMFEVCCGIGGLIASFLYHACQALDGVFFMSELKWHILDNIFVICNFANLAAYVTMFRDARVDFMFKFAALFVALVTQIKAPWEITHTIGPIALFGSAPFIGMLYDRRSYQCFDTKAAVMGMGLLIVAVPFFILGLDDDNDPYRIFHGLWHVFVGISANYMWRIVKTPMAASVQTVAFADNSHSTLIAGPRVRIDV